MHHKNMFAMILPYFISCAFVQPPLWEGVKVETRWLCLTVSGFPFLGPHSDTAQEICVGHRCDGNAQVYAVRRFDIYLCEEW